MYSDFKKQSFHNKISTNNNFLKVGKYLSIIKILTMKENTDTLAMHIINNGLEQEYKQNSQI